MKDREYDQVFLQSDTDGDKGTDKLCSDDRDRTLYGHGRREPGQSTIIVSDRKSL